MVNVLGWTLMVILALHLGIMVTGIAMIIQMLSHLGFLEAGEVMTHFPMAFSGYILTILGCNTLFICGCIINCKKTGFLFLFYLLLTIAKFIGPTLLILFNFQVHTQIQDISGDVAWSIRQTYGGRGNEALTLFWDTTMEDYSCCGYTNFTDFTGSPMVVDNDEYPSWCCSHTHCSYEEAASTHVPGCSVEIGEVISKHALQFGAAAMAVGMVEILFFAIGLICACSGAIDDSNVEPSKGEAVNVFFISVVQR